MHQESGDTAGVFIVPAKDRHIPQAVFIRLQLPDHIQYLVHDFIHVILFVACCSSLNADHPGFILPAGLLYNLLVGCTVIFRQQRLYHRKEPVVKIDDHGARAVIHRQVVLTVIPGKGHFAILKQGVVWFPDQKRQSFQLLGVTRPPSVNRLFGVAHQQAHPAGSQRVFDQRQQVVPLQDRCILELIQQKMVVSFPQAFIDERRRLGPHNAGDPSVELADKQLVVLSS